MYRQYIVWMEVKEEWKKCAELPLCGSEEAANRWSVTHHCNLFQQTKSLY